MSETQSNFEKEIEKHLEVYKDKLGKKKYKGVMNVYKEHLKNNKTRIRLRQKLKERREDMILKTAQEEW